MQGSGWVSWERRRPRQHLSCNADYEKLLSRHWEDVGAPIPNSRVGWASFICHRGNGSVKFPNELRNCGQKFFNI